VQGAIQRPEPLGGLEFENPASGTLRIDIFQEINF
jgi:hypothetical protein